MTHELSQVQEVVKTKEQEKEQIRRNLQAESRQLAALRAEMDQLRERFKSQEDSHVAAVADLQKAHLDEVDTLKAEMKNVQRGVPTGAEDALSPTQQLAFEQVSLLVQIVSLVRIYNLKLLSAMNTRKNVELLHNHHYRYGLIQSVRSYGNYDRLF